jgi:type I restriction-modification system DNA methylase subunit
VFLELSLPINNLIFEVVGQGAKLIYDTPHYAAALWFSKKSEKGSLKYYIEYLREFYPNESISEHLDSFERLFLDLNQYQSGLKLLVRREAPLNKMFHVLDGTHRAAILAVLGAKMVEVVMESAYQENI